MEAKPRKYNLAVITSEVFNFSPGRYQLRKGTRPDAPPCPFGHRFKWIGFDTEKGEYVRVTKSVFKRLINQSDEEFVEAHETHFTEGNISKKKSNE